MRRLLAFWLFLAPAYLAATFLVSYVFFRHVDLRYDVWASVVLVPLVQAAVLAWVTRSRESDPVLPALLGALRERAVAVLLVADAAALLAGWLHRTAPFRGLAGERSLQPGWAALKAAIAALLFCGLAFRRSRSDRGRIVFATFGLALLAWGADLVHPFFGRLLLLSGFGRIPYLGRGAIVYGLLLAIAFSLALAAGALLSRSAPAASLALDAAVASAVTGAVVRLLDFYWRPVPQEVQACLALTLGSLAATLCLAAALHAKGVESSGPAGGGDEGT